MNQTVYKIRKTDKEILEEFPEELKKVIEIVKSYKLKRQKFKANRKGHVTKIKFSRVDDVGADVYRSRDVTLHLKDHQVQKITCNYHFHALANLVYEVRKETELSFRDFPRSMKFK